MENLDELLEKVTEKTNEVDIDEIFGEDKIKLVLLGGYAKKLIIEENNGDAGVIRTRETEDIDFYSPDAIGLAAAEVGFCMFPTGTRCQLTRDTSMDIFDTLTGMDDNGKLRDMFYNGVHYNTFKVLKEKGNTVIMLPDIDCYVVNKLFSYRHQTTRDKDLMDIHDVHESMKNNEKMLETIRNAVKEFNLLEEYDKAINFSYD